MVTSNAERYPEAWAFFLEHARNIENETGLPNFKYRIPKPDMSGDFIYRDDIGDLFWAFKDEFYKPSLNSHSVYGQIQAITEKFSG